MRNSVTSPRVNPSQKTSDFSSTLCKSVPRIPPLFDQHLREVRKQGADTEQTAKGEVEGLSPFNTRCVHMRTWAIVRKKDCKESEAQKDLRFQPIFQNLVTQSRFNYSLLARLWGWMEDSYHREIQGLQDKGSSSVKFWTGTYVRGKHRSPQKPEFHRGFFFRAFSPVRKRLSDMMKSLS